MLSCSGPKELDTPPKKNSDHEVINEKEMKTEDDYTCNIEVINNLMPSANLESFMYAIVTLLPHSGILENNWKVLTFEIDEKEYTVFDELEYNSKDLLIYRNNVREIPKDLKVPFIAKVIFENDKGLKLQYQLRLSDIFEVH